MKRRKRLSQLVKSHPLTEKEIKDTSANDTRLIPYELPPKRVDDDRA